jgi:hypothetical protein
MKLSTFGSALVGLTVLGAAHASTSTATVEYTAVTGYFLQDEDATDASTFDYVSCHHHIKPYLCYDMCFLGGGCMTLY